MPIVYANDVKDSRMLAVRDPSSGMRFNWKRWSIQSAKNARVF